MMSNKLILRPTSPKEVGDLTVDPMLSRHRQC